MFDKIAQQVFDDIKGVISQPDSDLASSKIKALIESKLRKLNLVTREEFDAQKSVLTRTREQLQQLESEVKELEKQIADKE